MEGDGVNAKPADPERALAELERACEQARVPGVGLGAIQRDTRARNALLAHASWLLPLARAGLGAANMQACLRTTFHAGFTLGTGFGYGFAGGSAKDAAFVPSREVRDEYWSKYVYRVGDAAIPALALEELKERDALRAEFEACVRALNRCHELMIRPAHIAKCGAYQNAVTGKMDCSGACTCGVDDASKATQIALSGPLAAAVLRSPEPATPADGGAP